MFLDFDRYVWIGYAIDERGRHIRSNQIKGNACAADIRTMRLRLILLWMLSLAVPVVFAIGCVEFSSSLVEIVAGNGGEAESYQGERSGLGRPQAMADLDVSGDINLFDFHLLQECFTGPGQLVADPSCQPADFDGDGQITLADFALFQAAFVGQVSEIE